MTEDTETTLTPAQIAAAAMERHKLTVTSVFVPFSQSRSKGERQPNLNWLVTLLKDGRPILTTDYSAGQAHCPSYKQTFGPRTIADDERRQRVRQECETGFKMTAPFGGDSFHPDRKAPITPKAVDVLYSLIQDSDVIDYATYEEWAPNLGYDPDSRAGEKVYRACLELALKLRAGLGETVLAELREEAFENY